MNSRKASTTRSLNRPNARNYNTVATLEKRLRPLAASIGRTLQHLPNSHRAPMSRKTFRPILHQEASTGRPPRNPHSSARFVAGVC